MEESEGSRRGWRTRVICIISMVNLIDTTCGWDSLRKHVVIVLMLGSQLGVARTDRDTVQQWRGFSLKAYDVCRGQIEYDYTSRATLLKISRTLRGPSIYNYPNLAFFLVWPGAIGFALGLRGPEALRSRDKVELNTYWCRVMTATSRMLSVKERNTNKAPWLSTIILSPSFYHAVCRCR